MVGDVGSDHLDVGGNRGDAATVHHPNRVVARPEFADDCETERTGADDDVGRSFGHGRRDDRRGYRPVLGRVHTDPLRFAVVDDPDLYGSHADTDR